MIKRINKYQSIDRKVLSDVLENKEKILASTGGLLLTTTFLSGCGMSLNESKRSYEDNNVVICNEIIDQDELSSFDLDTRTVSLQGLGLTNIDELSNYKKLEVALLEYNNLSDISSLEGLPIMILHLDGNNIQSINLENFDKLKILMVAGNYNLYTQEIVDYCNNNSIKIDITEEDVKNIEKIKEMLNKLDLDGKTDLEKEQIICNFVCDHMTYDLNLSLQMTFNHKDNGNQLEHAIAGKGVCADYATLFTSMCQLSGINSYHKYGYSLGTPHAWSMVEIDGQYMLCDPTNIDSIGRNINEYIYFNASGDNAKLFTMLNETTMADKKLVESSDLSKLEGAEEEKKEELMKAILTGAAIGSIIFISSSIAKKMRERKDVADLEELKKRRKYLEELKNKELSEDSNKKTK